MDKSRHNLDFSEKWTSSGPDPLGTTWLLWCPHGFNWVHFGPHTSNNGWQRWEIWNYQTLTDPATHRGNCYRISKLQSRLWAEQEVDAPWNPSWSPGQSCTSWLLNHVYVDHHISIPRWPRNIAQQYVLLLYNNTRTTSSLLWSRDFSQLFSILSYCFIIKTLETLEWRDSWIMALNYPSLLKF